MTFCSFWSRSGWLDDIGLPQYKTQFDEGRVDGRMLHYMTVVSVGGAICTARAVKGWRLQRRPTLELLRGR